MKIIKRIPEPIAGVMLAFVALGNLIGQETVGRKLCGIVALILFLGLTTKIISDLDSFKSKMKDPIVAAVMGTYPMAMIVGATYIKPFVPFLAWVFWIGGLILMACLMIYFCKSFIINNFGWPKVFPGWFIVYVGMVVASVTGKAFIPALGRIIFWIGFIFYIILIPVVMYRVLVFKQAKPPLKPTRMIIAAPGSLCLAGYLSIIDNKSATFVIFLLILSQVLYLFALTSLKNVKNFFPSFSAYTFPTVITAMAMKMSAAFLENGTLMAIARVEFWIAVVLCIYVLIAYCKAIFAKPNEA